MTEFTIHTNFLIVIRPFSASFLVDESTFSISFSISAYS